MARRAKALPKARNIDLQGMSTARVGRVECWEGSLYSGFRRL